jgi:hypothetical protein
MAGSLTVLDSLNLTAPDNNLSHLVAADQEKWAWVNLL